MFRGLELNSIRRTRRAVGALASAGLFFGCAGTTPLYEGASRPDTEVAVISNDVRVKIIQVDDRKVNGGTFAVLPGQHSVEVKITFLGEEVLSGMKGMRRTCFADGKFIADAGQEYRVMRLSSQGKNKNIQGGIGYTHSWGIYLQNVTTDETLDDAMSELKCDV